MIRVQTQCRTRYTRGVDFPRHIWWRRHTWRGDLWPASKQALDLLLIPFIREEYSINDHMLKMTMLEIFQDHSWSMVGSGLVLSMP